MCDRCRDLIEDRTKHPYTIIEITEIRADGSYYNWFCPIHYCPQCGKKIEVKKNETKH